MTKSEKDNAIPEYIPLVHEYIETLNLELSKDEFDDLVSAGILGILEAMNNLKGKKAYSVAWWVNKNIRRQIKKQLKVLNTEAYFPVTQHDDVIDYIEKRQLLGKVLNKIAALPKRKRMVVFLKYFQGYTHDEILNITGWKCTTANISAIAELSIRKISNIHI